MQRLTLYAFIFTSILTSYAPAQARDLGVDIRLDSNEPLSFKRNGHYMDVYANICYDGMPGTTQDPIIFDAKSWVSGEINQLTCNIVIARNRCATTPIATLYRAVPGSTVEVSVGLDYTHQVEEENERNNFLHTTIVIPTRLP